MVVVTRSRVAMWTVLITTDIPTYLRGCSLALTFKSADGPGRTLGMSRSCYSPREAFCADSVIDFGVRRYAEVQIDSTFRLLGGYGCGCHYRRLRPASSARHTIKSPPPKLTLRWKHLSCATSHFSQIQIFKSKSSSFTCSNELRVAVWLGVDAR